MKGKAFVYYWLPLLTLMAVIVFSSSQTYDKQDMRPELARYINMHYIEQAFSHVRFYYEGMEVSIENLGPAGFVEFFIRKGAHFGTNFLVGFLMYRALAHTGFTIRKRVTSSLLFVMTFACLDEAHQMLTPTRTPRLADVMVDSLGGLAGILVCICLYDLFTKNYRSAGEHYE